MQRLFAARDNLEAHFLKNLLEADGVRATVLGELLAASRGEFPLGNTTAPGVWVSEEQLARGQHILNGYLSQRHPATSDSAARGFAVITDPSQAPAPTANWICPGCGESIEPQFTDCWKCGGTRLLADPALSESIRPITRWI